MFDLHSSYSNSLRISCLFTSLVLKLTHESQYFQLEASWILQHKIARFQIFRNRLIKIIRMNLHQLTLTSLRPMCFYDLSSRFFSVSAASGKRSSPPLNRSCRMWSCYILMGMCADAFNDWLTGSRVIQWVIWVDSLREASLELSLMSLCVFSVNTPHFLHIKGVEVNARQTATFQCTINGQPKDHVNYKLWLQVTAHL